jgi:phenylacetic acid degradation operon negative regulatory protein
VTLKPITPRSLVLDLLRVTDGRAVPVSMLVEISELFGFSGNALRVAVARLCSSNLIESDARGFYRLTRPAGVLAGHVEEWRLGEKRVRAWRGEWLAVSLPPGTERAARSSSQRALARLGFRDALPGLWLRPDNLSPAGSAWFDKLCQLGLDASAEWVVLRQGSAALETRLRNEVWNTRELVSGYRDMTEQLERSELRVEAAPMQHALHDTFQLGGSAIRLLATDPLLPEEIVPSVERARLTATMLRYDVLGRKIWRRALEGVRLHAAPAHAAVEEGFA